MMRVKDVNRLISDLISTDFLDIERLLKDGIDLISQSKYDKSLKTLKRAREMCKSSLKVFDYRVKRLLFNVFQTTRNYIYIGPHKHYSQIQHIKELMKKNDYPLWVRDRKKFEQWLKSLGNKSIIKGFEKYNYQYIKLLGKIQDKISESRNIIKTKWLSKASMIFERIKDLKEERKYIDAITLLNKFSINIHLKQVSLEISERLNEIWDYVLTSSIMTGLYFNSMAEKYYNNNEYKKPIEIYKQGKELARATLSGDTKTQVMKAYVQEIQRCEELHLKNAQYEMSLQYFNRELQRKKQKKRLQLKIYIKEDVL